MYDTDWAQRIYVSFCNDRTRTINMDNCIIQRILEQGDRHVHRLDIQNAIVRSIASKTDQELWCRYKRLIKAKSLDLALLTWVSNRISRSIYDEADRQHQLLLF